MASTQAVAVALFNAASGGYTADMNKSLTPFIGAMSAILEKDLTSDAAFVDHVLGNLGVTTNSVVFLDARSALLGLVQGKGREAATKEAIDFLAAQPSSSLYFGIATAFAAKVAKAEAFTRANANERDVSKLIAGVTGVDTDEVALQNAANTAKAQAEAVAAQAAAIAKTQADAALAAVNNTTFASEQAAFDAARAAGDAALKTAQDAAATAAANAKTQADAALAAVNNTTFASEQAAFDAAKAAGDAAVKSAQDAAAQAATIAKLQADAALNTVQQNAQQAAFFAQQQLTSAQNALAAVNNTSHASEQDAFNAGVGSVNITTDNAAAVSVALKTAAQAAGVTGFETMTDSQLISAIRTSDNAAVASGVNITSDNAAAVTLALRAAATDLGVTGTLSMTDGQLITAISTANDAAVRASVDVTSNDAAVRASVDITADNAAAITAALRATAQDLGVTGTSVMTNAQLITAITAANDTAVATAATNAQKAVGDAALAAVNDTVHASESAAFAAGQAAGAAGLTFNGVTYASIAAYIAATTPTQSIFPLTAGINNFTGTAGDDTFSASDVAGAFTLTALDNINGAAGVDTFNATVVGALNTTVAGTTVLSMEQVNLSATGGITTNTTTWGTTALNATNSVGGNIIATVAAGTQVIATNSFAGGTVTVAGGSSQTVAATGGGITTTGSTGSVSATLAAQAAAAVSINGGTTVNVSATGTTTGTVTIGNTAVPTGAVTVTSVGAPLVEAAGVTAQTQGAIAVTGGSSVTVSSTGSVTGGSAGADADALTLSNVTVTGTAATTAVTVTQTAAQTRVADAGAVLGRAAIVNGAVAITDVNAASNTLAGSITSVSLTNFGVSTVDSSAINSVTLGGTGGTFGIGRGDLTAVPTANTLALNTNALTGTNTITDNEAGADDGFTTINLTNTGTTVIADLVAADLTTLNIAGSGSLTLTANTLGGGLTTTIVSTSTGSVTLGGALTAAATYVGGVGVDTVTVGATATGTVNTGDGDDVITASTLAAAGRINAGNGTDTLAMTAADAATASANATFAAQVTSVERLSLGAYGNAATTVNLANLNNINYVTSAGASANAHAQAISGFTTGGTFAQTALLGAANNVTLTGSFAGTTDSFNLIATHTGTTPIVNAGSLTLAAVETVNISLDNLSTTIVATAAYDLNLDAVNVTSVIVSGDTGITFANSNLGTALTTFNASGVTGTAAAGAVTYTTGILTSASTITGGSGNDTLNAAAAIAAVTVVGGIGNDTITGSATRASNLNGGEGTDIITGGAAADVIDGGNGTDTYVFSSANVAEQTGINNTVGAVINLGATALSPNEVFLATGAFISGTQVASGTSTYLFNGESATNVSVIDTISNIENVTGSNLADYIVGSAAANVITGGVGADVLTGGAGADVFVMVAADAGDTITDFAVAADAIDYNTALVAIGGANALVYQNAAAGVALGATTTVFELQGSTTDGTAADLVTALAATAVNGGIDANDSILFVNYLTAGGAQVWRFVDADGLNVDAGELTLLVTLTGVAADAVLTTNFV